MDIGLKITNFLDISIIAILLYLIFVWFKKTRAAFVLIGIAMVGLLYLLALQFNLLLTTQIFQSFLTVVLIGVIIIFQQEIRYFFEQLAIWSLNRKLNRKSAVILPEKEVSLLVKTLFDFADEKIGALVVLQKKDTLFDHIDGGIELQGKLSEPLLKSIFDPHSMGHDGAVVVNGDRITHFAAHLPLSKDITQLGYRGTRHAAALGLSEVTDSLCLVVSEERGTISYALKGKLKKINTVSELTELLETFCARSTPDNQKLKWTDHLKKNWKEKMIAFGVAAMLWFVQIYGAELTYKFYEIPLELRNLSEDLLASDIETPVVKVQFTGARRSFYWIKKEDIRLLIDVSEFDEGDDLIQIADADLVFPNGLILRSISPREIALKIEKKNPSKKQA